MQQYGRSVFADRFAEAAADSDYSRFAKNQDVTSEDIRAAALALWEHLRRTGQDPRTYAEQGLDEETVTSVLLGRECRYADEMELVSKEFREYWDATDEMRFTFSTLDVMRKELTHRFLAAKRKEGFTVVDTDDGIWLFRLPL